MNYQVSSFHGIDLYKWKYDVTRDGLDAKYCIGNNGFDKHMSLEEVIQKIAIPKKANLIIKHGPNAKWYVKQVPIEEIDKTLREKTKNYIYNGRSTSYRLSW